jgi:hypothetical protein
MQTKTNIYAWFAILATMMVWAGCPAVDKHDHDHDDAGTVEEEADAGEEVIEDEADAGEEVIEEPVDAGPEEVDDCTAAEVGNEMTDENGLGHTCAPQEDADMCFNDDYAWEVRCANETCLADGGLCYRTQTSLWFNECAAANNITEWCDNITGHAVGEGSAIISSIAYVETVDGVASFIADLYTPDEFIESVNAYSALRFVSASGTESGVHDVPTLTTAGTVGSLFHFTMEFALGGTSANGQYAVYWDDGLKSNAYCFTNADMPADAWTHANNNGLGDLYVEGDDCGEEEVVESDAGVAEDTDADAGM